MYRVTFNGTIVSVVKDGACVSWEEVERLLNSALSPRETDGIQSPARVAEGGGEDKK